MARAAFLLLGAAVCLGAATPSLETSIDRPTIARAIALGRSHDAAALQRFHASYLIRLNDAPLDELEVVTEFRRVVLATQIKPNDISWGPEQAQKMLRPFRGTVSLVLRVTFPPQNLYRAMPAFDLVLYDRVRGTLRARDTRQMPQYIAGQLAPPGSPILGGLVEATFDAERLDRRAVYLAGIGEEGRELRRVEVDFSRIE